MEETNAKTTHLGTLTRAPAPIKSEVLKGWLDYYPNRRAATSLMTAFTEGVHINYKGPNVSTYGDNMKSAYEQRCHVGENPA